MVNHNKYDKYALDNFDRLYEAIVQSRLQLHSGVNNTQDVSVIRRPFWRLQTARRTMEGANSGGKFQSFFHLLQTAEETPTYSLLVRLYKDGISLIEEVIEEEGEIYCLKRLNPKTRKLQSQLDKSIQTLINKIESKEEEVFSPEGPDDEDIIIEKVTQIALQTEIIGTILKDCTTSVDLQITSTRLIDLSREIWSDSFQIPESAVNRGKLLIDILDQIILSTS